MRIKLSSLLVLSAALAWGAGPLTLIDDTVHVSAQKPERVAFTVRKQPLILEAKYEVAGNGSPVEAMLLTRWSAQRWEQGQSYHVINSAGPSLQGQFRQAVTDPGEYVVVLSGENAQTHVVVSQVFAGAAVNEPKSATNTTRMMVFIASALFIAGVYLLAGRPLLNAWRKRFAQ